MNVKSDHTLPKSPQEKLEIIHTINNEIFRLENEIGQNLEDIKLVKKNQEHIEILKSRKSLIAKCGELSLVRLNHLEEIFKHYCTHIYKTGKYMTFERLQYEKVHMTMDRFFLFLKDFDLTTATIEGKKRDVMEKSSIIALFKKMSSNARELSFEEFIQCIERLAVLYWDEKDNYLNKQKEYQLKMDNIKKINQKRRKRRLGQQEDQGSPDKSEEEEKAEGSDDNNEIEEKKIEKKEAEDVKPKLPENNENDDFVNELMNNDELQDPNEEVKAVAEKAKRENAVVQTQNKLKAEEFQHLLKITSEQKIEYYYQILDIDNIESYKNKLTSLNDPSYILHHKIENQPGGKSLSESKLQAAQLHEEERLLKLKAKMNQKKEKFKERRLPKPSNDKARQEEENSKRRKEMKKEREKAVKELKVEEVKKKEEKIKNPPKFEYKEGQISWQMLQKLTIDQLKIKQFNLSKLYSPDEDDRYFLQEFGGKPRINERLQARERQSLSIVESTKMRAQQLEKKQKERSIETQRKQPRQNTSVSRNRI